MFGKNDEYNGFGNYRQGDDHGYEHGTDHEDAKHIFQPFLEEGEEILWSMCHGNPYAQSPTDSDELKNTVRKMRNTKKIIFLVALIGVLLVIFGNIVVFLIGLLVSVVASLMQKVLVFFLIVVVVTLLIWAFRNNGKNISYAITDRRILQFGYSYFNEVRFENIQKTKAVIRHENEGEIITNGMPLIYIMQGVEDPYRVKYILDDAIEKYKRDKSQW